MRATQSLLRLLVALGVVVVLAAVISDFWLFLVEAWSRV